MHKPFDRDTCFVIRDTLVLIHTMRGAEYLIDVPCPFFLLLFLHVISLMVSISLNTIVNYLFFTQNYSKQGAIFGSHLEFELIVPTIGAQSKREYTSSLQLLRI